MTDQSTSKVIVAPLEPRVEELEGNVKELASALLGPEKTPLQGGGRNEEEGIVYMVKELWHAHKEGGVNAKLQSSDRGKILVALISSLSAVLVAIFT